MISITDGLRQFYLKYINEVETTNVLGITEWLNTSKEYGVLDNSLDNDFSIYTFDNFDFLNSYCTDINRISCAALDSINDLCESQWNKKFLGWNITKLYYSAFFSAHTILKIFGKSLNNIDTKALDKIRLNARASGFTYGNLKKGLYSIDIDFSANKFRFHKEAKYDNSHEGLWRKFSDTLKENNRFIYRVLPTNDAQDIINKVEELIEALCEWDSTNGNWLSRIRNQVNYSQNYGLWFPFKTFDKDFLDLLKLKKLFLSEPLTIDLKSYKGKELQYFFRTCQLINSINYHLLKDINTLHLKNNSFIKRNGVIKHLSMHQID